MTCLGARHITVHSVKVHPPFHNPSEVGAKAIPSHSLLGPLGEGPSVADGILQKWPQIISSSTHSLRTLTPSQQEGVFPLPLNRGLQEMAGGRVLNSCLDK